VKRIVAILGKPDYSGIIAIANAFLKNQPGKSNPTKIRKSCLKSMVKLLQYYWGL
jgi:hypothetical protein